MTLNPIKIIKKAFKNRTKFFLQMVNTLNTGITEIKANSKERGKKYISLFNKKEDILYSLKMLVGILISSFFYNVYVLVKGTLLWNLKNFYIKNL